MLTKRDVVRLQPGLFKQRKNIEMVDRPERSCDFLALEAFQVPLLDPRPFAGNDRHCRIGAGLGGAAAEIAERHDIHPAQDRADHRHTDLDDVGLSGLQRIQRIDAGRVGPRNGDIKSTLFEKAALECDRYRQHVDRADHADIQLRQRLRLRRRTGHCHRNYKQEQAFHTQSPSFIGPTLVTQ